QGIAICCNIRDANGVVFTVGSDCVLKTYAKGTKVRTAVEKAINDRRREAKAAKDQARIAAAREAMTTAAVAQALASKPSPNAYRASRGDTLQDWAVWMMANAGTSGRLDVCKV